MANPLYDALVGSQGKQNSPEYFSGMFQNFMQSFVGDPIQTLQQKLNSGEMNQQQYNQLRGIAEQIVHGIHP